MSKNRSLPVSMGSLCGLIGMTAIAAVADPTQAPPFREWLSHPIATRAVDRHGMGCLPTDDAAFDKSPRLKIMSMRGRPPRLLLTKFLPPVANQGGQQSCVAWSSAYYVYSYSIAQERHFMPDALRLPKWEFSPSYIYNQAKSPGGGMNLGQAFKLLRSQGCATMAEMPYDSHDDATMPTPAAKARAAKYIAPATAYVFRYLQAEPEAIKTYLLEAKQPFTTAIPIYSDFPRGAVAADYVYSLSVDPADRKNFRGGHAITVVGYDDDKKAFRIVNSWGEDWGDNGFLWISEDFFKKYAIEGWAETPGGPSTRSFMRGVRSISPHITLLPGSK